MSEFSRKEETVSVIIPVFQVSAFVERCLKSVMNQTYGNIECIIVNDASKDDSIDKCERLVTNYRGEILFTFIQHSNTRGASAARNTGINAAKGEFIFFLDSDDEITPDCIEKMVSFFEEDNTLELVQCSHQRMGEKKTKLHRSDTCKIVNNDDARKQFLVTRQLNYAVWNKLIKKSFIIDNNLFFREGVINEDLLWTFNLIKFLKKAYLSKEVTYYYHIRPGSVVTGTKDKVRGKNYAVIYEEMLHNLTVGKEREELKGLLYNFCYVLSKYYRCSPELKPIIQCFRDLAKQYRCYYVNATLAGVVFISRFCNPYNVLLGLNTIRVRMCRLTN